MVYWFFLLGVPIALWIGAPLMGFGWLYDPTYGFLVSASIATYFLIDFSDTAQKLAARVQELESQLSEAQSKRQQAEEA